MHAVGIKRPLGRNSFLLEENKSYSDRMSGKKARAKKLSMTNSMRLFRRAAKVMPGGVSSNARMWQHADFCPTDVPCTLFVRKAKGPHIWDVDGNKYVDYRLGFGPVILGHSHPGVVSQMHAHEKRGSVYAFDNELEVTVAEKMVKAIPCAEMVRYSVTGTEATMHAIRLARGYTKRKVIMKFEGHYHGGHDYLLFSTAHTPTLGAERPHKMSLGIPDEIDRLVEVAEFNNFEDVEKKIKRVGKNLAAVIMEPMMGNGAGIMPVPGFLKFVQEMCERNGSLLIADEVKTGFRVAYGGAQELFKFKPQLATYAKSISNGYPLSAIAGEEEIMKMFGQKKVFHGGTYAGNPMSMVAADATLDILKRPGTYRKMNAYGRKLMNGIDRSLRDSGVNHAIQGAPTMFQFVPAHGSKVTKYHDIYRKLRTSCDLNMFSKTQMELMKEGVMIDMDQEECLYLSLSHGKAELKKTLDAFDAAVPRAVAVCRKPRK